MFAPIPGEMIQFDEHIFQMGWNHQPETVIYGYSYFYVFRMEFFFETFFWHLSCMFRSYVLLLLQICNVVASSFSARKMPEWFFSQKRREKLLLEKRRLANLGRERFSKSLPKCAGAARGVFGFSTFVTTKKHILKPMHFIVVPSLKLTVRTWK